MEDDGLPDYGVAVTRGGQQVGTLTSPATSPLFGPIALAILDAGAAGDGERVDVVTEGGPVAATVAPLAIYDPEKRRPRS